MHINSFNNYLKARFGRKIYKISLDAGMTCPNRDGTIGHNGCIFCSAGGSGDFASSRLLTITEQINEGRARVQNKIDSSHKFPCYIAYFQAYTNTYAPIKVLRKKYMEAALHTDIAAISIATRPDCIDRDIMELIMEIHRIKPVFIELGLQTSNEATAHYIRRGYANSVFAEAVRLIHSYNENIPDVCNHIHIVVHAIIGLPGEDINDMEATINYINTFPVHGVKLQLLHILRDTALAEIYEKDSQKELIKVLSLKEYADILIRLLLIIRPDIVIHRITGDGPKNILLAPLWSCNKKHVLNYINRRINETPYEQGAFSNLRNTI